MAGSVTGNIFKVMTWGESHGYGLGAVVDGCPAGIEIDEEYIQKDMDRRRPGGNKFGTKRNEGDKIKILSGVFEGKTTGTPISLAVINENQRSGDYGNIMEVFRPGHADMGFYKKYGFRDYRGGGRSSGRETLARVAAGAVARKFLSQLGISIKSYTLQIGSVKAEKKNIEDIFENQFFMPDKEAAEKAEALLKETSEKGDSLGGVVECVISGMPIGIGEPVFEKLDSSLAKAFMSIGAVKGVEFGGGFSVAEASGSENNDEFYMGENGKILKKTNNSGGILGGMSDGADIVARIAFKPTPSISQKQNTVDIHGENREIEIKGRHDPVIVPRAVVVTEAMAAITAADMMLMNLSANIENIKKVYGVV
ncbi:MAG: chorismate synthase [Firmicutes bacterium]|nr:chorismate synthase [Bacillota bacterium]